MKSALYAIGPVMPHAIALHGITLRYDRDFLSTPTCLIHDNTSWFEMTLDATTPAFIAG